MMKVCNRVLSSASKADKEGNLLVRCPFELSNIGEQEITGDLYISAKTHKLYICMALDSVLLSQDSKILEEGSSLLASTL
jgi:hypothetical protein